MVIYVDMLILINFITDYFLLKVTAGILKVFVRPWRCLLASFLAALFSLYIFLPQNGIIIQVLVRVVFCFVIVLACFGFKSKNFFIKASGVFFCVTFAYAGAMWALWTIFKPNKMAVKNTVVYFDISPLALILSSAVFYLVFTVLGILFPREKTNEKCLVSVFLNGKKKTFSGFCDTGNKLRDPFFGRGVIIINKEDITSLLEDGQDNTRVLMLPCNTVSGRALLEGYRLDLAKIKIKSKSVELKNPIAAFSLEKLEKDTAIINPETVT